MQYENVRKALSYRHSRTKVFIRAVVDDPASDEVLALNILSSGGARKDPRNHVVGEAFLLSLLR
jgi:hypothetical protein